LRTHRGTVEGADKAIAFAILSSSDRRFRLYDGIDTANYEVRFESESVSIVLGS